MTINNTTTETRTQRTDAMTQSEVNETMQTVPAVAPVGAFYALTFRNFRLFFIGQLISVAGTWMQSVAQNWLVWQLTHSAKWLGVVSGASALPFVAFAIWGGQIADRRSRRAILVWTQTIAMLLAFTLALLASPRLSPIPLQAWHVVLIAALGGVVNAFNMPAQQAFVTDMVEDRRALGNAIALNSLRFNMARVLGPLLAGITLVHAGVSMCFFLNGLSFIAVIISLLLMRLPPFIPQNKKVPIREGFHYILQTHSVLRIILLIGAASILTWPLSTLFPMFADYFHKGEKGYSVIMAANGLGAALGGLALASLGARFDRRTLIYGGAALFCVSGMLLAVAHQYLLALGYIALSGYAMIIFGISSQTKVQEDVPDALRGRVLAVYTLVFNGFFSIGGFSIGEMAQRLNAQMAIAINSAICLVITGMLYAWSLAEHRRNTPPPLAVE